MEECGDCQSQIKIKKRVGQSEKNKIICERKECEALSNTLPHNVIIKDLPPPPEETHQ